MKKIIYNWENIDWKEANRIVREQQQELVRATELNDRKTIYRLQRKLVMGWASCALAVRRVTTSTGSKIPGVDKELWNTPKKKYEAIQRTRYIAMNPKRYKASPVKRVYIPKPGSEERKPLGIPTLIDRAVQALYHQAIDPVVETTSDLDSYGFRKFRSAQDCITRIKSLINREYSPTWIMEADIEKCFDKINHDFLIENTPICDKKILTEWLKAGVSEAEIVQETEEGTPQGGIISPLLCNITLNGMETFIKETGDKLFKRGGVRSTKIHVVRYAYHFIILGPTKKALEVIRTYLDVFLLKRGLKVKESKTRIITINNGFDFLGFNIKKRPINHKHNIKYNSNSIVVVKPSIKSLKRIKREIKDITKKYEMPIRGIINKINPLLRGWTEYFRISYYSTVEFWKIGHYVWKRMMIWMTRKHPRRNMKYLINRYVIPDKKYKWIFGNSKTEKVFNISEVTSWWPTPLKRNRNPYIDANRAYFEERQVKRIQARFRSALYKKHRNICEECGESLYNGENVEMHHVVPKKKGGSWKIENIVPLHEICHKNVTIRYEKEEKAETKGEIPTKN